MGFSVSGASAVVFVGLLICAGTLYPSIDRYTERRSEAMSERSESVLTRHNTVLSPGNATWNASTNELTITAANAGATTLTISDQDLLVDGVYVPTEPDETTVATVSTTDLWQPGETLRIEIDRPAAPDRVKLVSGPGVAVTMAVEGA